MSEEIRVTTHLNYAPMNGETNDETIVEESTTFPTTDR